MDVGVCLPYMKQGLDRGTLLGFARAVEAGPFASLSCGERITGPTVDLGLTMAAAAAVTSRVRIVPTLYVLPLHDAVKAAKEIATLDVLSGGRAAVTIGVGGRPNDYRAVSAPFERRHARMDEQVATLRRIWRGEPPFEGADPVGPAPRSGRRPAHLRRRDGPEGDGARGALGRRRLRLVGQRREERDRAPARADRSRLGGREARPTRRAASAASGTRSRRRIRSRSSSPTCTTTSRTSATRRRAAWRP